MYQLLRQHKLIIGATAVSAIVFGIIACARQYTFQTQTWDLAAFEQSFWNTLHGSFMFNTFEGKNHFAVHFSPFLILLVPFYAIWESPYTLLMIQTIAIASAAIPLYLYANLHLDKRWAQLVTIAYLLYPSVGWVTLFDFHAVPFAIPLVLWAFYFIERGQYTPASIFLIATAAVEEDMIIAIFFIGLYVLFFKNKKYGLSVSLISLIYFIAVAKIFMPALGGGIVRLDRYSQFGATSTAIIDKVITDPALTAQTIMTLPKLMYGLKLYFPLAFIPLFAPSAYILMAPGLLQNLLTNFDFQFSNFYQYDSILIPFIFVAFVIGLRRLLQIQHLNKTTSSIIIACVAVGFIWNSPLSPFNFPFARFTDPRANDFRKIISTIPPTATVAAYTNLVPHLTHRQYIFMAGYEPFFVDYVILDGQDLFGFPDQAAFNNYFSSYQATNQYSIIAIDNRYFILRRESQ